MEKDCLGIAFTKMQGAGNDYVYINALERVPEDLPQLSRLISDRHFGVGSDGLVAITGSEKGDFRMRMFNSDGSEAEMCGNASRCIGKYLYEKGLTDKRSIRLETGSGIKVLELHVEDGIVNSVTVDMGEPELRPAFIPVKSTNATEMIGEPVTINGKRYEITGVSMGNPHAVLFYDTLSDDLVLGEGPVLERAEIFPRRANIEFARVISHRQIEMRVWERGSGETLACGTGACATAVAGVLNGLTGREVTIKLLGGDLNVRWDEKDNHLYLSGEAEFVCDGIYYPPKLK